MSVSQSVADLLDRHISLELESIDRMYLNVYVPKLQYEAGVVGFFRHHRRATFVSSALMAPISRAFVSAMEACAARAGIPLVRFEKRQRKDEVAAAYLARFEAEEGILTPIRSEDPPDLLTGFPPPPLSWRSPPGG